MLRQDLYKRFPNREAEAVEALPAARRQKPRCRGDGNRGAFEQACRLSGRWSGSRAGWGCMSATSSNAPDSGGRRTVA